jgi:dephospho-CoA kinase
MFYFFLTIFALLYIMIRIGLSGNRFSGKDKICSIFRDLSIPIFDADVIIKFMLSYDYQLLNRIKDHIGDKYFDNNGLKSDLVENDRIFGKVFSFLESELFDSYYKFERKNKNSVYTIFKSSILYEMKWHRKMTKNITVYSPFIERVERAKKEMSENLLEINFILNKEMDELEKNRLSDFTIHNYNEFNIKKQVNDIDQKIIDYYLTIEEEYEY